MDFFPVFLSVVVVLRNRREELPELLRGMGAQLEKMVSDYELIVIDNASVDESVAALDELTRAGGLPNLQVYALTKEVDADTASWVGVENALGDFVAVIDPLQDDIAFLPTMMEKAVTGSDVVFATNTERRGGGLVYRASYGAFHGVYRMFNGINLAKEAAHFRVLSKNVVNFILQHPQPIISYRHLPASGGFSRVNLTYTAPPKATLDYSLLDTFDRGMRLVVSTTRAPMRFVTMLSLFGAFANLIYSLYVLAVWLVKPDVAPGWVSLSLQMSGMFLLISLVLLVLGEYIINMASLSNEGPAYHIGREFTSARMTRHEKLNIEELNQAGEPGAAEPSAADAITR